MKGLMLATVLMASSVYANTTLDQLSIIEEQDLDNKRGMYLVNDDQDNTTSQVGAVFGKVEKSITGYNNIASGSFAGAHGVMMVNMSSGNNNITNMNTNVNIISAK